MGKMVGKVKEISWHRNGVSGEGFYAIRFTGEDDENANREFLGILFKEPGQCAIVDVKLANKTIDKWSNAWRGDYFEPELREAIKNYEEEKKADLFLLPDHE